MKKNRKATKTNRHKGKVLSEEEKSFFVRAAFVLAILRIVVALISNL